MEEIKERESPKKQEISKEDHVVDMSERKDDTSEEKEENKNNGFEEDNLKNENDIILENFEIHARKKYIPSKGSYYRNRFNTTWVQYADGLGYAYGGADPLNYNPHTKNRFIRKVFIILFVMMTLSCLYNAAAKIDLQYRPWWDSPTEFGCTPTRGQMVAVPVGITMGFLNIFMALSECARATPAKQISLFLSFIGISVVTGFITMYFNTAFLVYIYGAAGMVCLSLFFLGFTSYNFLHWSLHFIGLGITLPIAATIYIMTATRLLEPYRDEYTQIELIVFVIAMLLFVLKMTLELRIVLGSDAVDILEDDYTLGLFYLYTSSYDIYIKIIQLVIHSISGGEEE